MSEQTIRPFDNSVDNEDKYDADIVPLMTKIYDLCIKHNIAMVGVFQFAETRYALHAVVPIGANPVMSEIIESMSIEDEKNQGDLN